MNIGNSLLNLKISNSSPIWCPVDSTRCIRTRAQRSCWLPRVFITEQADELASLWLMNLNAEQFRESKEILEVTSDKVKEVSRKSNSAPNYLAVAVGEEKVICDQTFSIWSATGIDTITSY